MARGMNGEIVLKAEDIYIGRVAGELHGYNGPLKLKLSVRMERLDRRDEYETIDHRKVSRPLDFSIVGALWRMDNRDIVLSTPGEGIADLLDVRRNHKELASLGEWHLNAMRAGCAHQGEPVYRDGRYGREIDLGATPACPVTGYRYGSAWLVRELPDHFEERVRDAFAPYWKG